MGNSSEDPGDWKVVRRWQKSFGSDIESYAVFQSRTNELLFAATRSFVVGGFEQDQRVQHRALDAAETDAILSNPESFHRRMDLS